MGLHFRRPARRRVRFGVAVCVAAGGREKAVLLLANAYSLWHLVFLGRMYGRLWGAALLRLVRSAACEGTVLSMLQGRVLSLPIWLAFAMVMPLSQHNGRSNAVPRASLLRKR